MIHRYNRSFDIDYTYIDVGDLTYDMIDWLCEQPGHGHFVLVGTGVYFEEARDATMFSLRWS